MDQLDASTQRILLEIEQGRLPAADELTDSLLLMAVRAQAVDQEEARELIEWDLATIAEFLALRLEREGLLNREQVTILLSNQTATVQ
jgi:hypothetical protein